MDYCPPTHSLSPLHNRAPHTAIAVQIKPPLPCPTQKHAETGVLWESLFCKLALLLSIGTWEAPKLEWEGGGVSRDDKWGSGMVTQFPVTRWCNPSMPRGQTNHTTTNPRGWGCPLYTSLSSRVFDHREFISPCGQKGLVGSRQKS
jgi:hypothetical protein